MSLFFSLYFFQAVALVTGVLIVLALGLGLFILGELNLILSATEELKFSEKIDTDSFRHLSLSPAAHTESTVQAVSSLP